MLISINLHKKSIEVSIKARSTPASTLNDNDHNQVFWARETEHPQQTIVLTKTAGQQPWFWSFCLTSSCKMVHLWNPPQDPFSDFVFDWKSQISRFPNRTHPKIYFLRTFVIPLLIILRVSWRVFLAPGEGRWTEGDLFRNKPFFSLLDSWEWQCDNWEIVKSSPSTSRHLGTW